MRSRAYAVSLLWRLPLGLAAGFVLGVLLSGVPVLGTLLGFWAGMEMALVPGVENGPLARWMDRSWVPYGQTKTRAQMRALASRDPDAVRRNADTYYVFDEAPRRSLIDENQLAAAIADALNREAGPDESRRG